jgi:acetoin utilization protein AcuB
VGNGRRDRYGAVRDWMTKQPAAVGPDCSIADAMARMRRANVRHLLVVDAGRLVGIVSHRDWRRVEVRAEDPVTVAPETAVIVAARELLERKIGCLPVRDGEEILGIFTTSDALEALLSALD